MEICTFAHTHAKKKSLKSGPKGDGNSSWGDHSFAITITGLKSGPKGDGNYICIVEDGERYIPFKIRPQRGWKDLFKILSLISFILSSLKSGPKGDGKSSWGEHSFVVTITGLKSCPKGDGNINFLIV